MVLIRFLREVNNLLIRTVLHSNIDMKDSKEAKKELIIYAAMQIDTSQYAPKLNTFVKVIDRTISSY